MPARPLDHEPSASRVSTNDGCSGGRRERGIGGHELDARAVRSDELGRAPGDRGRIATQEAKGSRRSLGARIQPQAQAVAGDHRDRGSLGGVDERDTEAEPLGEERERGLELRAGQDHLGRLDLAGFPLLAHAASGRILVRGRGGLCFPRERPVGDRKAQGIDATNQRLHPLRPGREDAGVPPGRGGPRRGVRRGLPHPDLRPRPLPARRRGRPARPSPASWARRCARSASPSWTATASTRALRRGRGAGRRALHAHARSRRSCATARSATAR